MKLGKASNVFVLGWAVVSAMTMFGAWRNQPQAALLGKPAAPEAGERIQLAILLDTSGSMEGLLQQAKSQLWRIVNELGSARRGGKTPRLEIALYEYGNATLSPDSGFIRQVLPLTTDLDRVSEQLFALSTSGGYEHCGQVIQRATTELAWADEGALRLIYIAGNEPFTQGPVDYRTAVGQARARGITVDTVFCGPAEEGQASGWKDGALAAGGTFLSIDHNRAVAHEDAPQDAEIARLGALLNETYLVYGADGAASCARQSAQDGNAALLGTGSAVSRSVSKANPFYDNSHWDLVDARRNGRLDWSKLPEAELSASLRGKTAAEREQLVAQQGEKRAGLQRQINELAAARGRFLAARQPARGTDTLDRAIIDSARRHAEKAGFRF